jgi:Glycolipid transfer protein (GLTP)
MLACRLCSTPSQDDYPSKEGYPSLCQTEDEHEDLLLNAWPHSPTRTLRSSGGLAPDVPASVHHEPATAFGTWTVGKLSVMILAFATVVDFALCHVQSMESPEFYDALSADVIRPAFKYHKNVASTRPRTSLGSAAISSVTEALSPILPFTGGLDLRKQDYWRSSGNIFETLHSVASQVQEAFSSKRGISSTPSSLANFPRGGGNLPGKLNSKRKPTQHVAAISAPEPFVSLNTISELTLSEVSETFRYAVECNKEGFAEARYLNGLAPRVKKVVSSMQEAMAKSRGKDAKLSMAKSESYGEVDALAFSAAMRIFAEWRLLRSVPEGYKGFAVGMSLGHKDVVQNLAKIEQGAHDWLNRQRDIMYEANEGSMITELRSPTLKEVLGYEVEEEINPTSRLPRLKDKSASMGALWVRRQLHYQTLLFDNVVKVPSRFSTTADAVAAAYKSVYDKYHGWAVQKIFNYSFQSAPEAAVIFMHMHPEKLKDVMANAQKIKAPVSLSSSKADKHQTGDDNPVVSFFKHVGGEWDKLASNVGQVFGHGKNTDFNVRGGSASAPANQIQDNEVDAIVTQEMVKDAHEHISTYLKVVKPLLNDLEVLFDKMNMDDPTRV